MRHINEIIIHCTATRPNFMQASNTASRVSEIKRWHVEDRGWRDIGYHYLIDRDGTVAGGRPPSEQGAHVRGHNAGTIGIALFGGHGSSENDQFEDNFTPQQNRALRILVAELQATYPTIKKISGHNEYAAKACPGFRVSQWLSVRRAPEPVAPPPVLQPTPAPRVPEPAKSVRVTPLQSTTIWAQIKQWAAQFGVSGWAVFQAMKEQDVYVKVAVIGVVGVLTLYMVHQGRHIIKERLKKWAAGDN